MNAVKLIRLTFGSHLIEFKDGVNYIYGLNATGKTTIFNLISYVFGLKKDFGFFKSFFKGDEVSLKLLIANKEYLFKRNLASREIEIISHFENRFFNVSSGQFSRYLSEIFQPRYEYEVNDNVVLSLLKESFISDIGDINMLSTSQKELKLMQLGVNAFYPRKIRSYLKELTIQLNQKQDALSQLTSYKNDVEFLLIREFSDQNSIKEILQSTLGKYKAQIDVITNVIDDSNQFLQNLNERNEQLFREKQDYLNPLFKDYLMKLSIDDRPSINDVIEGTDSSISYGRKSLIKLVLEILVQSTVNVTNGIGLIVNDAALYHLDYNNTFKLRELIQWLAKEKQFQYIEFVSSINGIEKNDVVFDTGKSLQYV